VITEEDFREIGMILKGALLNDFRPLIYVIPIDGITSLVENVPIEDKAHPLSEEYIITELPRAAFDIIEVY
jgi:hypothetical protein